MDSMEPMQVDEESDPPMNVGEFNIENPNLDLDAYSNSFTGLARVRRLMFIARHCTSFRSEAFK